MLSIDKISNDKEATLVGLKKRGFGNLDVIDELIKLNSDRKQIQQKLDQILFESNTISKEIAEIFKSGNQSNNVEDLKSKSADIKSKSKDLSDQLEKTKSSI
jgi:seryl-tRNA synthetase